MKLKKLKIILALGGSLSMGVCSVHAENQTYAKLVGLYDKFKLSGGEQKDQLAFQITGYLLGDHGLLNTKATPEQLKNLVQITVSGAYHGFIKKVPMEDAVEDVLQRADVFIKDVPTTEIKKLREKHYTNLLVLIFATYSQAKSGGSIDQIKSEIENFIGKSKNRFIKDQLIVYTEENNKLKNLLQRLGFDVAIRAAKKSYRKGDYSYKGNNVPLNEDNSPRKWEKRNGSYAHGADDLPLNEDNGPRNWKKQNNLYSHQGSGILSDAEFSRREERRNQKKLRRNGPDYKDNFDQNGGDLGLQGLYREENPDYKDNFGQVSGNLGLNKLHGKKKAKNVGSDKDNFGKVNGNLGLNKLHGKKKAKNVGSDYKDNFGQNGGDLETRGLFTQAPDPDVFASSPFVPGRATNPVNEYPHHGYKKNKKQIAREGKSKRVNEA